MTHLEFARRSRRWTQSQLGQAAKIDPKLISWIELGRFIPNADELDRLSRALELPADRLLKPVVLADAQRDAASV